MLRILVIALLVLIPASAASAFAACAGADPTIVSVVVTSTVADGGMNHYHISGRVSNRGTAGQASNVLQFVDIYDQENKADAKSIPPLKPGQSYTFSYVYTRSAEAGPGTTQLAFQLHMRQPSSPGRQNCNSANDRYVLNL